MHLIFFTHPTFLNHQSMPRFANMLAEGMRKRGHQVELWSPEPEFYNWKVPGVFKKWLGYIDQYLVFPKQVRARLKTANADTLFVLTDHALGPWLPLVADRRHVVHCHDFLAQQSALDLIPENPTSATGKIYQAYIRRGYSQGKNFISVSKKTQQDLHSFINPANVKSQVAYNGLNQAFGPKDVENAREKLSLKTGLNLSEGYLLHIGGNQWYKNRLGVVEIYDAWRNQQKTTIPLLLIGEKPDQKLLDRIHKSIYQSDIHYFNNIEDSLISDAYTGAVVFLFPSLAEGFGWPIAEAMACGCPVITTDEAPMTEVAGNAGYLISKMPQETTNIKSWAKNAAKTVEIIFTSSSAERKKMTDNGLENAKRFDVENALDQIENIYKKIVQEEQP